MVVRVWHRRRLRDDGQPPCVALPPEPGHRSLTRAMTDTTEHPGEPSAGDLPVVHIVRRPARQPRVEEEQRLVGSTS